MKTENAILMKKARESLAGNWGVAIGACVIYLLVVGAGQGLHKFGTIVSFFIAGPMSLGLAIFFLSISRATHPRVVDIFEGFNQFGRALKAYAYMALFVFLWSLLLVIPGIIAALSYSQIFFILADDPVIPAREALRKSKQMMEGYKWKFFCLCLRFLGWFILSILTFGIGFLWLIPYIQVSMAKFYEDIKG